jgi:hypothetical protein
MVQIVDYIVTIRFKGNVLWFYTKRNRQLCEVRAERSTALESMMKHGSRILVLLLLTLLLASCTSDLRVIPKPLYIAYEPMSDLLKEYKTFTFKPRGTKGSVLIEGYLQRYLQTMLENKGYQRSEDSPDFLVSVDWSSELADAYLTMPGLYLPAHDHSPYSYWSSDTEGLTEFYEHEFEIKLWNWGMDEPMWFYTTRSSCEIQDYRMSAPSLLKNFILYVPTVGTQVRPGEHIDDDEFVAYVRHAIANRDWTLPGLKTYVTWTERYGILYDARALRDQLSNPELIGLYVDMLENSVQYRIVGDELEMAGHYMVGQREYYVTIKAKYNGERFMVTEAQPISSSAFTTLREEILSYTVAMEQDYNVFKNYTLPFHFKVEEWDGVPNPFEPETATTSTDESVLDQN